MDFLTRNRPLYKTATGRTAYAPQAASNGLTSLFGSLFGSATPAYKAVDGGSVKPSGSSVWAMLVPAPSYKPASEASLGSEADEPSLAVAASAPLDVPDSCETADPDVEASSVRVIGPDTIVLL